MPVPIRRSIDRGACTDTESNLCRDTDHSYWFSHGTMQYRPDYLNAISTALEFNLPLRMPHNQQWQLRFPNCASSLNSKGIVFTDYFVYDELENYEDVKSFWTNIIKNLKPVLPNCTYMRPGRAKSWRQSQTAGRHESGSGDFHQRSWYQKLMQMRKSF